MEKRTITTISTDGEQIHVIVEHGTNEVGLVIGSPEDYDPVHMDHRETGNLIDALTEARGNCPAAPASGFDPNR